MRIDFVIDFVCSVHCSRRVRGVGAGGGVGNEKREPQNEMVFSPGIPLSPSHQKTKFDFF